MFVPNIPTFRQVSVLIFIFFSCQVAGETSLYDELSFLEEASKSVEVYLPGDKIKKSKKAALQGFEDSISTGQAGLLKTPLKTDSYEASLHNKQLPKKRLRFRSR